MASETSEDFGSILSLLSPEDLKAVHSESQMCSFRTGQAIVPEGLPSNLYIVVKGEVLQTYHNGQEHGRVLKGRSLEMKTLVEKRREWKWRWFADRDTELLAVPWDLLEKKLGKNPRVLEYIRRITRSIELQKLKRDLRIFGYDQHSIVELITSLKFDEFSSIVAKNRGIVAFTVLASGLVELAIDINGRRRPLARIEVGDQALIDLSRSVVYAETSPDARCWYLTLDDIRRLDSKHNFIKFIRLYHRDSSFGHGLFNEETVWLRGNVEQTNTQEELVAPVDWGHTAPKVKLSLFSKIRRMVHRPKPAYNGELWNLAVALVAIGKATGKEIGLYSAKRALVGRKDVSGIKAIFEVCGLLKFDVGLHSRGELLAGNLQYPVLTNVSSRPVFIWAVSKDAVDVEYIDDGTYELVDTSTFEKISDLEVLRFSAGPNSLNFPDRSIGILSYVGTLKSMAWQIGAIVIASTLSFYFSMVTPMVYQYLFTQVVESRKWSILGILLGGYFGARLLNILINRAESAIRVALLVKVEARLASTFFTRLTRVPLKLFDFLGQADLLNRYEKIAEVSNGLTGLVLRPLCNSVAIASCSVILYLYHPSILYAILISLPFALLVTGIMSRGRKVLNAVVDQNQARERAILIQAFDHPETVRANNAILMARWKWEENFIQSSKSQMTLTVLGSAIGALDFFFRESIRFVALWVGVALFFKGELTLGQVIACFFMVERIVYPLWGAIGLIYEIPRIRAQLDSLDPLLTSAIEERHFSSRDKTRDFGTEKRARGRESKLELRNVSFSYGPKAQKILQDVSIQVFAGERVAIVGPSGSGKSTLTKLMNGLRSPNQGKITLDGNDISSLPLHKLRKNIALLEQDDTLFNGSILENITMASADSSVEKAVAAARMAGADSFINRLPQGYNSLIYRGGVGLSEGQAQTIKIARMLYADPELFVFDESTCHLDSISEEKLINNLFEATEGKTLVFVTQHVNILARMDRIFVLESGRIINQGKHLDLIHRCPTYIDFFTRQVSLN